MKSYREIFDETHGPGPWPCFFCEESVERRARDVHHIDGNHDNNDPRNLAPTHPSCHISHHQKGRKHPPDCAHCAAVRGRPSPNRGKKLSPEHRAKLSAARQRQIARGDKGHFAGRKHTDEAKAKIGQAARGRTKK